MASIPTLDREQGPYAFSLRSRDELDLWEYMAITI